VSLRAHATLRRRGPDEFECELEVHKDKEPTTLKFFQ
jgi:hypothetical protein